MKETGKGIISWQLVRHVHWEYEYSDQWPLQQILFFLLKDTQGSNIKFHHMQSLIILFTEQEEKYLCLLPQREKNKNQSFKLEGLGVKCGTNCQVYHVPQEKLQYAPRLQYAHLKQISSILPYN